ncbi:DUF2802 domain-containing protein [Pleionea sediminis]|uniref:DUF2802 domain-containing protein n=1 Tax=Pleionea sediminis TaxID=2569479 RepID=UPI00118646C5|nr:DUF2802 domain-containing protein [Pleionea sediminis]
MTLTMTHLLIALLVTLQAAILFWVLQLRTQIKVQGKKIQQMNHEQQAIVSGNLGLGRKLFQFKNNLTHLEQSQVEIEQTSQNSGAFEQAAKMLRQGISIEDVIESCHISRGEAELLKEMLSTTSFH